MAAATIAPKERVYPPGVGTLTAREREVLRLMSTGLSNLGISSTIFVSDKTVEVHVSSIFIKLGLQPKAGENRRVQAVLAWISATSGSR